MMSSHESSECTYILVIYCLVMCHTMKKIQYLGATQTDINHWEHQWQMAVEEMTLARPRWFFFKSSAMLKERTLRGPLTRLSALTVTGPYAASLIERDFGRGTLCSRMNHCHSMSVRSAIHPRDPRLLAVEKQRGEASDTADGQSSVTRSRPINQVGKCVSPQTIFYCWCSKKTQQNHLLAQLQ